MLLLGINCSIIHYANHTVPEVRKCTQRGWSAQKLVEEAKQACAVESGSRKGISPPNCDKINVKEDAVEPLSCGLSINDDTLFRLISQSKVKLRRFQPFELSPLLTICLRYGAKFTA